MSRSLKDAFRKQMLEPARSFKKPLLRCFTEILQSVLKWSRDDKGSYRGYMKISKCIYFFLSSEGTLRPQLSSTIKISMVCIVFVTFKVPHIVSNPQVKQHCLFNQFIEINDTKHQIC